MVKTCIMQHNMKDLFKTYREMHLQEVKQKEVDSLKKLSKDMQSVLKGYQKIARMGDKEISNVKYNKDYEAVLKARDVILQLIGKVNTQKILNKEETTVDLDEARMPDYKKTKFDGKEFDKKKEVKNIKNMIKALHKVAKMQDDFQYTAETGYTKGGNPNDIYKGLVESERALYTYLLGVERGQWDGIIDMDRD